MPRLPNRGTTNRAPGTSKEFPAFPNFDPLLEAIDGGKTNASFQQWATLMRARLEGNATQDDGRFRSLQTTNDRQDGYLESVWTMEAIAGPVVTGMTLFSSVNPKNNTTVSRVTFQADVFQINTSTGNHKTVFSTSADAIKLGDVLTVDLVNAKVFIGTGTYANSNTAFYVDDDGFLSLKNKLTFDPTGLGTLTVTGAIIADSGTIGGWQISSTTLSKNNTILDSAGQLVLGTANDIIYVSAVDALYRLWIGNSTSGTAAFRVTKTGIMTAINGAFTGSIISTVGAIGGFTIGATTLSAGTGANYIELSSSGPTRILLGDISGQVSLLTAAELDISNSTAITVVRLYGSSNYGVLELSNLVGTDTITLNGSTGSITAAGFLTVTGGSSFTGGILADTVGVTGALGVGGVGQFGDGLLGGPGMAYTNDIDTGWWRSGSGIMNAVSNGVAIMTIRSGAVVFLGDIKLNNSRVPGAPVPGGTVTMLDASGLTINVITT